MLPQLPQLTLRLRGSGRIEDLRRCMKCLYKYWYHKGYWGVTTTYLVDFCVAFIMLVVSFVFTMRFQWQIALHCTEADCVSSALIRGISWPYIYSRSFLGHLFGMVVFTSTLVVCVYEGARLVEAIHIYGEVEELVRDADIDTGFLTPYHRCLYDRRRRRDELYDHEVISLRCDSRRLLSTMSWGDFIERMCASLGRHQQLKSCSAGTPLDVLRAMQSMLHTENYLISLYDSGILTIGALRYTTPRTIAYLVSAMFDSFNTVLPVQQCVWSLRIVIAQCLVLYVVFYLFIVTYSLVKVLVKHAAQAKSNYRDFTRREWNYRAEWSFRLYNEVSHLHACRLASAGEVVHRMICRLEVSSQLSRLMRRTSSICVLIVVVLSFMNPHLLIGGSLGGFTLVWWLTLALLVYTTFTEEDPREREYVYTADLHTLVHTLHYSRTEWYDSGEAFVSNMTRLFVRSRGYIIASDLLRAVFMPYILYRLLVDGSVEVLTTHVHSCSVFVEGVGSVTEGAVFFEREARSSGAGEDGLSESAGVAADDENGHRKRALFATRPEAHSDMAASAAIAACRGSSHSSSASRPACVTDTAAAAHDSMLPPHRTVYEDRTRMSPDACCVLGDIAAPASRALTERVRMSVTAFSSTYPQWTSQHALPTRVYDSVWGDVQHTRGAIAAGAESLGRMAARLADDADNDDSAPPPRVGCHEVRAPLLCALSGPLLPRTAVNRPVHTPACAPHCRPMHEYGSLPVQTREHASKTTRYACAEIGSDEEPQSDRGAATQDDLCCSVQKEERVPANGHIGSYIERRSNSSNSDNTIDVHTINTTSSCGCPRVSLCGAESDGTTLAACAAHVRHSRECHATHEGAKSLRTFLRHLSARATRYVAEAAAPSYSTSTSCFAYSESAAASWQDGGACGGAVSGTTTGHASTGQNECSVNHVNDGYSAADGVRCCVYTEENANVVRRGCDRHPTECASHSICSSRLMLDEAPDANDNGGNFMQKRTRDLMCAANSLEQQRLSVLQAGPPLRSACSGAASLPTTYGANDDTGKPAPSRDTLER